MTPEEVRAGIGPKLMDGLRAYIELARHREDPRTDEQPAGYWFVDAILERQGYHPNVAASIIDRMDRKGWIECGVSERTGWLTDEGKEVARRHGLVPVDAWGNEER